MLLPRSALRQLGRFRQLVSASLTAELHAAATATQVEPQAPPLPPFPPLPNQLPNHLSESDPVQGPDTKGL